MLRNIYCVCLSFPLSDKIAYTCVFIFEISFFTFHQRPFGTLLCDVDREKNIYRSRMISQNFFPAAYNNCSSSITGYAFYYYCLLKRLVVVLLC